MNSSQWPCDNVYYIYTWNTILLWHVTACYIILHIYTNSLQFDGHLPEERRSELRCWLLHLWAKYWAEATTAPSNSKCFGQLFGWNGHIPNDSCLPGRRRMTWNHWNILEFISLVITCHKQKHSARSFKLWKRFFSKATLPPPHQKRKIRHQNAISTPPPNHQTI